MNNELVLFSVYYAQNSVYISNYSGTGIEAKLSKLAKEQEVAGSQVKIPVLDS